jgi:hypothetical protein
LAEKWQTLGEGHNSNYAFGLKPYRHLALEVVDTVTHEIWRFELLGYNDSSALSADRKGWGPFGPFGYFNQIAVLYSNPATRLLINSAELNRLNQLSQQYFGADFPVVWDFTMLLAEVFLSGSLRKAYGIYIATNHVKNPQFSDPLGVISQAQLNLLIQETMKLAGEASTAAFFLNQPGSHAQGFNIIRPSFTVGLGYDPLLRNSNSFIGTIMRKSGLAKRVAPGLMAAAVGFGQTFDEWTPWDLAIQTYMSAQAGNAGRR